MTANAPETETPAELSNSFKTRADYFWNAWSSGEAQGKESDAQTSVRRIVERDRDDAKAASAMGLTLAAFTLTIATFMLKDETGDALIFGRIAAGLLVLVEVVLVYTAQRRVTITSDLLTRMDLSLASKKVDEAKVGFFRPLLRPFLG